MLTKEKLKYLARWAASPFAAVGAAWLTYIAARLLYELTQWQYSDPSDLDPEWYTTLWREGVSNGLMGFSFVACGASVAPSHRAVVAAGYFGMAFSVSAFTFYLGVQNGFYFPTLVRSVALIGGSGFALFALVGEQKRKG